MRTPDRHPRRGVLALLTVGLVLAGCTLRQDDQPREITRASLPDVLFQQTPANATPGSETRTFFLVKAVGTTESLVKVQVPIQPPADPADFPRTIIEKLVIKPPSSATGEYRSVIPLGTRVLAVKQHDDVLDIDLSNALGTIENTQQRLAIGQIVFTATAINGVTYVRFFVEGTPSAVPVDDHTAEAGALISRNDFPKLISESAATTTTTPPATTPDESSTTATDRPAPVVTDSIQGN
jgi:spore germination protein GerM